MKLTKEDRENIRFLNEQDPIKWSKRKLAKMYGVAWSSVYYIINPDIRRLLYKRAKEQKCQIKQQEQSKSKQ